MKDLAAPIRQLVDRRLWPVALLLLAALVAIPVLLAKQAGTDAGVPPATSVASASGASAEPIVSLTDEAARESRRKVLGSKKNPFRPAIKAKKGKVAKTATSLTQVAKDLAGTGSGKTTGGGTVAPTTGGTVTPTEPEKVYELYSLGVRFGDSTADDLTVRNLKRLKALPDADAPALIYLGLLSDLKTAVFLVDAGAKVQGDGKCMPDPANCQTLRMKVGDTAFIDVAGSTGSAMQYQLDLVRIRKTTTTDATAAAASRKAVADGGRKALRARVSRAGRWSYDKETGTLKRLSDSAFKAAAARYAAANAG